MPEFSSVDLISKQWGLERQTSVLVDIVGANILWLVCQRIAPVRSRRSEFDSSLCGPLPILLYYPNKGIKAPQNITLKKVCVIWSPHLPHLCTLPTLEFQWVRPFMWQRKPLAVVMAQIVLFCYVVTHVTETNFEDQTEVTSSEIIKQMLCSKLLMKSFL